MMGDIILTQYSGNIGRVDLRISSLKNFLLQILLNWTEPINLQTLTVNSTKNSRAVYITFESSTLFISPERKLFLTYNMVAAASNLPHIHICNRGDLTVPLFLKKHSNNTRNTLTLEFYLVALHKIFSICVMTCPYKI